MTILKIIDYIPIFCNELSELIHSGISVIDGMQVLIEDEADGLIKNLLTDIHSSMSNGNNLSFSLSSTNLFPNYMIDMIEVAENTGKLEDTLSSLSNYYTRQDKIKSELISAITAPIFLIFIMLIVTILIITQVLPIFETTFSQLGVSMGVLATSMLNLGVWVERVGIYIILVLLTLIIILIILMTIPRTRQTIITKINYHLGDRGLLGDLVISKFASVLSMGVSTGLYMDTSIELASKVCKGSKSIDQRINQCKLEIESGVNPIDALVNSNIFSTRDARLLKLSEHTGNLSNTLFKISQQKDELTLSKISHIISFIEPVIITLTSILSGVILFSIMLPLLDLMVSF